MFYQPLGKYLVKGEKYYKDRILHYCPACDELHPYAVDKPFSNGHQWTFNNNLEKPSFYPSMNMTIHSKPPRTCHYFVTDGQIIYCGDCTHEYSGKTIPLPEIPEKYLKLTGD